MPGSGKSTLGRQLAEYLNFRFIDTDELIENHHGESLQSILDKHGYLALRNIEAEELLQLQLERHVVATGGSAVYSEGAMMHLQKQGTIVYLKVDFEEILTRIDNEDCRGIARPAGQSLQAVYAERTPRYQQFADITIDNNQLFSLDKIVDAVNTGIESASDPSSPLTLLKNNGNTMA